MMDYHARKELLREWLKSRRYHVNDVRTALKWWEKEKAHCNDPSDAEVLAQAEASYRQAVEAGCAPPPYPVEKEAAIDAGAIEREIYMRAAIISAATSVAAIIVLEAIRWMAYR